MNLCIATSGSTLALAFSMVQVAPTDGGGGLNALTLPPPAISVEATSACDSSGAVVLDKVVIAPRVHPKMQVAQQVSARALDLTGKLSSMWPTVVRLATNHEVLLREGYLRADWSEEKEADYTEGVVLDLVVKNGKVENRFDFWDAVVDVLAELDTESLPLSVMVHVG